MNISQEKEKEKERDQSEIENIYQRERLPQSPQLIQNLHLISQGLKKIENVGVYKNLISLWINSNEIEQIQNLEKLLNLRCLYLQENRIKKIEGLENLDRLEILNLEKNWIKKIENLNHLQNLKNLNLAHNQLQLGQQIAHLKHLKLQILDISNNEIQNKEQVFNILKELTSITCLSVKATPFSRGFKNYRKNIIAYLHLLKFLDDRPVYEVDHRLAEAWLSGGIEQERVFRTKIMKQQEDDNMKKETEQKKDQRKDPETQIREQLKLNEILSAKRHVTNEQRPKQFTLVRKKQNDQIEHKKSGHSEQTERTNILNDQVINIKDQRSIYWPNQYNQLLKVLLQKYRFDFSQVQPQFNMITSSINKKLARPNNRYEIEDLQKMWTLVQIQYRQNKRVIA